MQSWEIAGFYAVRWRKSMTRPPSQTPFVGLRSFDIADRGWFYGRNQEIVALLHKVCSNRFTAVVGAPGCGKSSLVRCGVLASLVKDGWKAIIAKPGSTSIAKLALALTHTANGYTENLLEACTYWHDTKSGQSNLTLNEIARQIIPDNQRLLLVIDQFEELFRYGEKIQEIEKAAMEEERRNFIELLLTAAFHGKGRLHVIITLRSDYIGNCTAYYGLNEAVNAYQFPVLLPDQGQLEDIIRGPVDAAGGRIDEILVQRLLLGVIEQAHPLPWLQHTMQRLWKVTQGEPRWLREQNYHTISGKPDAINTKPEQITSDVKQTHTGNFITLKRVMSASTILNKQIQIFRPTRKHSARPDLVAESRSSKKTTDDTPNGVLNESTNDEISIILSGTQDGPGIDTNHEVLIRSWQYSHEEGAQLRTDRHAKGLKIGQRRWKLPPHKKTRQFNVQGLVKGSVLSFSILSAITLIASISIFIAQTYYHEKTHQKTESLNQLRAQERVAAEYAQSLIDSGHARRGALIALHATPKSRRSNHPQFTDEIGAALADALTRPIEIMQRHHRSLVYSVVFSPDGHRFASSGTDNALRLWNAKTGALIGEPLRGHDGPVNSIAFSPDGTRIVSGSWGNTLRLWDANTGKTIGEPLHGHASYVISVAFSPAGNRIVSASWDKTLRLWDAITGMAIGEPLRGHTSLVYHAAYSPDGSRIVSGSEDKTVRLWDANTGAPIGKPLRGHDGPVNSVTFSPDGGQIASGSSDHTLRLWDAHTGMLIGEPLLGHDGPVNSIVYSPDSGRIVSGSWDDTLRLWDASNGKAIGEPLRGHEGPVDSVAFSPDGSRFVSGSTDKTLRMWETNGGKTIGKPLSGHESFVYSVTISSDSSRIVSGSEDKMLRLWDANTGAPIGEPLHGHDGPVNNVAFSPDGRRIVSGSTDRTLRIWDANSGNTIGKPLIGHNSFVYSIAFSPNGNRIVSGSEDKLLRLWDANTGVPIGEPLTGHNDTVYSVAFSPDGRHIVSGSRDKTLRLWDANTGKAIGKPLTGHDREVNSVAFSPDGSRIVSGSSDNTVRLWDVNTSTSIGGPMHGHDGSVNSVAFSPDGRRIVSGSSDKTLQLWDTKTGKVIGNALHGHAGMVYSVAFSPDGNRIISSSSDKTLRLWDIRIFLEPWEALVKKAEKLCPLSPIERQQFRLVDPTAESIAVL
jgi:WD40 repeat protein